MGGETEEEKKGGRSETKERTESRTTSRTLELILNVALGRQYSCL